MAERTWSVYLAGEIHSDWRERIEAGTREAGLPVSFSAPVTDHAASDDAGAGTLGEEGEAFWRDHNGAGVNAIRTQTLIRAADLVVVRLATNTGSGTRPSTPASPPPSASRSSPSTTPSWTTR